MAREKIISGIDVGTTGVRVIVGGLNKDGKLRVLGAAFAPTDGVRKGAVVNVEEVSNAIKKAAAEAERISGFSVAAAYVSVGGAHIDSFSSKGVVAVSRANGEISKEDVNRAIQASQSAPLQPNKEILHIIPKEFRVDNESGIKEPKGMHGVRLEVDSLIIEGSSPFIKNLVKAVENAKIDVLGLIFAPLAAARATLSERQKELGSLILDVGGQMSGLAVFEEGSVIHAAVLPVGSSHVTGDIAIAFRIPIDEADKIKINYGTCLPEEISKKETVKIHPSTSLGASQPAAGGNKKGSLAYLPDRQAGQISPRQIAKGAPAVSAGEKKSEISAGEADKEDFVFSRREAAEIIQARVCDIFELVNKELKKINRTKLLPAGIIISGGGAKLAGIVDLAKQETHLPAEVGFPFEIDGVFDKLGDPSFAVLFGLLLWGADEETRGWHGGIYSGFGSLSSSSAFAALKKLFKILTP